MCICFRTVMALALIVLVAFAASTRRVRAAEDDEMRLVFYGFVDRQPRAGTAIIDGTRLTERDAAAVTARRR